MQKRGRPELQVFLLETLGYWLYARIHLKLQVRIIRLSRDV